jgi:cell division protein FtsN
MTDEGVREIQLSSKGLVALFMGAAVVLVVTFLCGVFVGRGVRAQKEPVAASDVVAQNGGPAADPTASASAPQAEPSAPPAPVPSTPPPTPPDGDLSYTSRLEGKPVEPAKAEPPAVASPAPKPVQTPAAEAPRPAKTEKAAVPATAAPVTAGAISAPPAQGEPAGQGFAFRVAAYKGRAQADQLASKLAADGYSSWVVQLPATTKAPGLFSVRVGKYKTTKDADAAKHRLQKEGYKPSLIGR